MVSQTLKDRLKLIDLRGKKLEEKLTKSFNKFGDALVTKFKSTDTKIDSNDLKQTEAVNQARADLTDHINFNNEKQTNAAALLDEKVAANNLKQTKATEELTQIVVDKDEKQTEAVNQAKTDLTDHINFIDEKQTNATALLDEKVAANDLKQTKATEELTQIVADNDEAATSQYNSLMKNIGKIASKVEELFNRLMFYENVENPVSDYEIESLQDTFFNNTNIKHCNISNNFEYGKFNYCSPALAGGLSFDLSVDHN